MKFSMDIHLELDESEVGEVLTQGRKLGKSLIALEEINLTKLLELLEQINVRAEEGEGSEMSELPKKS